MENSVEQPICTAEVNDGPSITNERVNGDGEPLREIGNTEIFAMIEKLRTTSCANKTDAVKTKNNDAESNNEEKENKNVKICAQNPKDSQEVELSPPENVALDGYSVTPVGAETSYKGVPSAQILEDLHSKKPVKTEPSEPKTRKKQRRSKQQFKPKSGGIKSVDENAKDDDKSSFTRKLQQFLSSSINFLSPQSKTKNYNSEETELTAGNNRNTSNSCSVKAKKCLIPVDSSQPIITGDKKPGIGASSKAEETCATEDKTYSKAVTNENIESKPATDEETISSDGSKTTLGALKEFLGVGSPKRTPNSRRLNSRKDSTLVSTKKEETEKPGTSNGVSNYLKSYSRRELMKLSSLPSCRNVPNFEECVDESVKKDLDCGSTVKSKYLPINILSREFKLKYRL